jgi:hypothetical protein
MRSVNQAGLNEDPGAERGGGGGACRRAAARLHSRRQQDAQPGAALRSAQAATLKDQARQRSAAVAVFKRELLPA